MNYLATVTSKRQLTIPIDIYRLMNLVEGNKVLVSIEDQVIKIEPAQALVEKLAGSVKLPKRFKNKTVDQIITLAKKEYFKQK
ncbi:MAG: AbrB/MazE/SpoVT family DNA-binding domain-containing protein [Patescibacteria group bacterium]|nr:AbrB/MazE/SpoVT family DNA-binding domain-containing protein [Patescibacteria group bacterium]